jgi:MFS transporter, ACS family, D-galactonate transporter
MGDPEKARRAGERMATRGRELKGFAPALALLVAAVLINYLDRGNLALAAPLIKAEWGLSATQLGVLFSAFFWTYMALQFAVGELVDRFSANIVMAVGFLIWSAATALTGLAAGFATLLLMRLMLGVGESVMFPASSKICAQEIPEETRGLANSMLMAAIRWGSALGTFAGGMLIAHYGWRRTFVAVGLVSLIWLPAWRRWKPPAAARPATKRLSGPRSTAILRQRSFWGASLGHFCGNYIFYFLISWLPYYLVRERHLSMTTMVGTAGMLYAVDSASCLAAGWLADRAIKAGSSVGAARKWAMGVGFGVACLGLAGCVVAGPHSYLVFLAGVAIGSGAGNAGNFAFGQTLAGAEAAGKWAGLQNGFANLSGIVGPALTGYLVDRTGNFGMALAIAAAFMVVGGVSWVLVVGKVEQLNWAREGVASAAE